MGIDMLRNFRMQETIFVDAERDDAVRVVLFVVGVRGPGFHDGFDGVWGEVRESSF